MAAIDDDDVVVEERQQFLKRIVVQDYIYYIEYFIIHSDNNFILEKVQVAINPRKGGLCRIAKHDDPERPIRSRLSPRDLITNEDGDVLEIKDLNIEVDADFYALNIYSGRGFIVNLRIYDHEEPNHQDALPIIDRVFVKFDLLRKENNH